MKANMKSIISFISPALGLTLLGLWMYMSKEPFVAIGYLIFGLSIFMICFGIYFKIQSYKSRKIGLTSDDELSKRIKEKATAKAFYYSFRHGIEPKVKIIMGFGLRGMALVFFLNWLYYSKVGISDENKN